MIEANFIGSSYINLKGNTISVISCTNPEQLFEQRQYICRCSLCSEDSELWPEGSIVLSRGSVRGKRTNCSCSAHKYSLEQWVILAERKATELGCEILKVYNTERKRRSLRVDYKNSSGKIVNNISVENFMQKELVEKDYLKGDAYYIDKYYSNSEIGDKIFCRESSQLWKFKCLSCEKALKDLDIKRNAIFKTKGGSLLEGSVGCLCNSKVSIPEDYLIANAKNILSRDENEFIYSESFNNSRTYIHWKCPYGHLNRTHYSNIVSGKGCRGCRSFNAGNTLYDKYLEREDYLYLLTLEEDDGTKFHKVGRSFNTQSRLNSIKMVYNSADIIYSIKNTHKRIYHLERFVKNYLLSKSLQYTPEKYFAGCATECFKVDDLHQILLLAERVISEF